MFKRVSKLSRLHKLSQILTSGTLSKSTTTYPNMIQYQDTRMFGTVLTIKKWDLYSAVCLERHPIIVQPMQELELKFHNVLKKIEYENSFKSDHELKLERDKRQEKQISMNDDLDTDNLMQTAQDFEDNWQEELKNFKFAPTFTEFDKQNVTSSLKRKLDSSLLLLIHQRIGDKYHWIPPQGVRQKGETMRQTAERVLQDACGTKIKVKFYGNAPIGYYKYKYPQELREKGTYGAKVFYFLAKYIKGSITNDVKHQWLDQDELEKILPSRMQKSILQFMLHI